LTTALSSSGDDGGDDRSDGTAGSLSYDGWTYGKRALDAWEWTSGDRVSHLTLLLYLSTHGADDGGETALYPNSGGMVTVRPAIGAALIFPQTFSLGRVDVDHSEGALAHAGLPVRGCHNKYVLRSEVLYRFPSKGPPLL
jgi:hypothetical protein